MTIDACVRVGALVHMPDKGLVPIYIIGEERDRQTPDLHPAQPLLFGQAHRVRVARVRPRQLTAAVSRELPGNLTRSHLTVLASIDS